VETVSLTFEQRSRPRRRCLTDAGTEVALAFPRGTILADGMLIHNTATRAIQVRAEEEDVIIVCPDDQLQMCIIAHHLGNWHRSVQLGDDGTLVLEAEAPLISWLNHRGIKYNACRRPYHPNLKGSAHD